MAKILSNILELFKKYYWQIVTPSQMLIQQQLLVLVFCRKAHFETLHCQNFNHLMIVGQQNSLLFPPSDKILYSWFLEPALSPTGCFFSKGPTQKSSKYGIDPSQQDKIALRCCGRWSFWKSYFRKEKHSNIHVQD